MSVLIFLGESSGKIECLHLRLAGQLWVSALSIEHMSLSCRHQFGTQYVQIIYGTSDDLFPLCASLGDKIPKLDGAGISLQLSVVFCFVSRLVLVFARVCNAQADHQL